MNSLKHLFLVLCLILPASLMAQSVVGTYKLQVPNDEGGTTPFKVELKADNTYSVDVGMDGAIDWTGKYSLDGNQITIQDDNGECTAKGLYTYTVSATELKMTMVKDDCPNRGNPDAPMVMTRM